MNLQNKENYTHESRKDKKTRGSSYKLFNFNHGIFIVMVNEVKE